MIFRKYPDNLSAIMTDMQYQMLNEMGKDNNMTGEWIVFAKHNEINYYLCLAVHNENGKNDETIYSFLKPCIAEFPELKKHLLHQ